MRSSQQKPSLPLSSAHYESMSSIKLTNVPRTDMPHKEGRSRHVYQFWDANLSHQYGKLNLPSTDLIQATGDQPHAKVLKNTWFNVKVTHFDKGSGTIKRWPFETTITEQAEGVPTDRGTLDAEDVGDLLTLVPDLPTPSPQRAAEGSPAADSALHKVEITDTRARKFRLKVPADLRAVLWNWYVQGALPAKNKAIELVNGTLYPNERSLYKEICTSQSDFAKLQSPEYLACPNAIRRNAVLEAVAARKAILTKAQNSGKTTTITPVVANKRQGFTMTLAKESGAIMFKEQSQSKRIRQGQEAVELNAAAQQGSLAAPELHLAPKTLKKVHVNHIVPLQVHGQKNRKWLYDLCKEEKERQEKAKRKKGEQSAEGLQKDEEDEEGREDDEGKEDDEEKEDGQEQFVVGQKLPLPRSFSIQLDEFGKYNLIVHYKVKRTKEKAQEHFDGDMLIIGGDPGLRNPLSGYQSDGTAVDFGDSTDTDRLAALRSRADDLQSQRMAKVEGGEAFVLPSAKRRQLWRQERKIWSKHKNLVDDFHRRVANYLAVTGDAIVMPRMDVRGMIQKKRSVLSRKTKRSLLAWSQSKFLDRLTIKAHDVAHDKRYPDKKRPAVVLVQPEAYTSKTCAKCGTLNEKLGSSKKFRCASPGCGYIADRDHNGAINMIIKAMRNSA